MNLQEKKKKWSQEIKISWKYEGFVEIYKF